MGMAALSRELAAPLEQQAAPLVDVAESLEEQAALALRADSAGLPWLGVASGAARGASLAAPLACAK
jgi:hypothetical protein